jgi:hypothetical protein
VNYFLKFEMLEVSRRVGRLALQFSDRSEVLVETLGEVNHHVLQNKMNILSYTSHNTYDTVLNI